MKVRIDDFIDLMMDRLPEMEVEDGIILAKGNVEKYIPRITADDMWPSPHDDYALKTALIVRNIANGFKVPEKPYMKDVTELF